MGTVAHYLEVNASADTCYGWWRGLTNLPSVLPDVEKIEPRASSDGAGDQVTHWTVHGPLGTSVEWDARIVEDVPGERIAWASIGGTVANSGAVRFDDHGESTGVEVSLTYDPPAGAVGEAVAKLFADPQDKVERALAAFKTAVETAHPGDATTTKTNASA